MKRFLFKLLGVREAREDLKTPDFSRDADEFIRLHPGATLVQWREFALRSAESAYEAGFIAGSLERMRLEDNPTPEEIADIETPGWRDSPAIDPHGKEIAPMVIDSMILGDAREK